MMTNKLDILMNIIGQLTGWGDDGTVRFSRRGGARGKVYFAETALCGAEGYKLHGSGVTLEEALRDLIDKAGVPIEDTRRWWQDVAARAARARLQLIEMKE